MKNLNTYTIALVLLLSAVSLIVGVKYTLTDRKACIVSQPTYSLRNIQYPTTTPSVVTGHPTLESAPSLLLPITATTPAKHYRSRTSYNAGANLSKSVSRTYTTQQLTQMSSQTMHSSAVSAIRTEGYNAAAGSTSNAPQSNAWYAGSDSRSTGVSSSNAYTGITASPFLAVRGKTSSPTLAYASTPYSTSEQSPSYSPVRRVAPSYDGHYQGETFTDTEGTVWTWDEDEGWVSGNTPSVGDTKIENGIVYRWDGSAWVFVSNQADPDAPLGDIPWLLFALLLFIYIPLRSRKTR